MNAHEKKILLAVDGSNQSLEAVCYVSKIFSSQKIKIHLLHVLGESPDVFYELGKEHRYRQAPSNVINREWISSEESINRFMSQAYQILIDAGIPKEEISIDIDEKKTGIATDIIVKSIHGYSAVVMGRSGVSKCEGFITGRIANNLIKKLTHVSICVVGGKPTPEKILITMDESQAAMRAVDFVGGMFGESASEITLFHVVREYNIFQRRYEDIFDPNYEKEWVESYEIESLFEEAKMHLVKPGVDPNRLNTKLVKSFSNQSDVIIKEAKEGGYGTIVVGRRGISKKGEFYMGEVSDRVIQLAGEQAVWIVN